MQFRTARVAIGSVEETITALGSLEPKEYVDVGAQVSGQLKKLYVERGERVVQGDLLAEIDATVLAAKVTSDEARLKSVQAMAEQQRVELDLAGASLKRTQQLFDKNTASAEALDTARAGVRIAEAKLRSLEAQVEEAEATLDGNQASLGYTKIFAPLGGTIVSIAAVEGQTLNATQQAPSILRIANLDVMTVRAQVVEADVGDITPGMPAYFRTLGNDEETWRATVAQVLPTPESVNDVILYNVLIDIPNNEHRLMIDMTAQVFFVKSAVSNVPIVPVAALRPVRSGAAEWEARVVNGNGIERRTVRTGVTNRTEAEVISGLETGEEVVTGVIDGVARRGSGTRRPIEGAGSPDAGARSSGARLGF